MKILEDLVSRFLSPDKEKQVLRAFAHVTKAFALGTGRKTVDQFMVYGQEVEPTTGLSRQILVNRAISDLASPKGWLQVIFEKLGQAPLASFFEAETDTDMGRKVMLGVKLNLEAGIKFGRGTNFQMSESDTFSVAEALVAAMVAFDRREKNNETALILKRSENLEVLDQS